MVLQAVVRKRAARPTQRCRWGLGMVVSSVSPNDKNGHFFVPVPIIKIRLPEQLQIHSTIHSSDKPCLTSKILTSIINGDVFTKTE